MWAQARAHLRICDSNVHFQAAAAKPYEITGDTSKPEWDLLFGFILARMSHLRFLSTVYVLVDNRDLTNLDNPEPSLQHWPAVAARWSSRACIQGPAGQLCDVVYFPISQASGLHLVHPTWAGTFVLAALCLVFPGLHIVLFDSDCVPVTLFEVFFFLPVPRALEAQTVINSSCFDWRFPRKREKVRQ